MISDGVHIFEWNARNQLHSLSGPSGQYGFAYDAKGRRYAMTRSVGGTPVSDMRLIWNGPSLAEERDLTSSTVRRVFQEGEQTNGVARFLTRDHLGSVYDETDGAAAVINRTSYDPYGRAQASTPPGDLDRGFAGSETLEGGALVLTPHRIYDPETARWLVEDPMGLDGGLNLYGYVDANPLNATDPLGLKITCKVRRRYDFQSFKTKCEPDALGCMTPRVKLTEATPCEGDRCKKFKFNATLELDLLIEFPGTPFWNDAGDCDGKSVAMHEEAHADDMVNWCKGIKTEGFDNWTACDIARESLIRNHQSQKQAAADASSKRRDCYKRKK
jgi:RHS repeat-associated protein